MSNNSDFEANGSLNDAFELIKGIFNQERATYEKTIKTLKNKVSELEKALSRANEEKIIYQTKISNMKRKLTSISKTVSKLEDSDFEFLNEKKDLEKIIFINNKENYYNNIKYRNNGKMNSFRKKTKFISNISRSASDNFTQILKNNFLDNESKQFNNGEDIKTNYINKTNNSNKPDKKSLSSKIKRGLLNVDKREGKSSSRQNNLFKNYSHDGENNSLYLHSNGYHDKNKFSKINENLDKRYNSKKIEFLSVDKYNKIEQKIKGIKSNLNIFKEKEESKINISHNDYSNSINEENSFS